MRTTIRWSKRTRRCRRWDFSSSGVGVGVGVCREHISDGDSDSDDVGQNPTPQSLSGLTQAKV
mgnify:CR=1 FL=1